MICLILGTHRLGYYIKQIIVIAQNIKTTELNGQLHNTYDYIHLF